jgi:hypothetical protein
MMISGIRFLIAEFKNYSRRAKSGNRKTQEKGENDKINDDGSDGKDYNYNHNHILSLSFAVELLCPAMLQDSERKIVRVCLRFFDNHIAKAVYVPCCQAVYAE